MNTQFWDLATPHILLVLIIAELKKITTPSNFTVYMWQIENVHYSVPMKIKLTQVSTHQAIVWLSIASAIAHMHDELQIVKYTAHFGLADRYIFATSAKKQHAKIDMSGSYAQKDIYQSSALVERRAKP